MSDISLDSQIKCVEREIGLRKRVYPRWIEQERMTAFLAHEELETMKAVLLTLTELRDKIEGLGI